MKKKKKDLGKIVIAALTALHSNKQNIAYKNQLKA